MSMLCFTIVSCHMTIRDRLFTKLKSHRLSDEQEALNSIMQDLAELHRSSRPAMFLSDLGKPKASSPKNQVTTPLVQRVRDDYKSDRGVP